MDFFRRTDNSLPRSSNNEAREDRSQTAPQELGEQPQPHVATEFGKFYEDEALIFT